MSKTMLNDKSTENKLPFDEILKVVKDKLPGLSWTIAKNNKIKFKLKGTEVPQKEVLNVLLVTNVDFDLEDLRQAIIDDYEKKSKSNNKPNTPEKKLYYESLPIREIHAGNVLTKADHKIWEDLKFVTGNQDIFYVKDGEDCNTYTAYLTPVSSSDKSDIKVLKNAYYGRNKRPEVLLANGLEKITAEDCADVERLSRILPATAWDYISLGYTYVIEKINGEEVTTKVPVKLAITNPSTDLLYKGVIDYEAEFRLNNNHIIDSPVTLTNSPETNALAYIDLDWIQEKGGGKSSDLWDEFLLQRLHNPDYVSIFKAWTYAIAVGNNTSRQEMWLYGNGGTGKSTLCKAFIKGFNDLAGKDICLAASKDTGKSNFNSELLNKHLLVYPDAKNTRGGMSEFKHCVTGGDYMRIEAKGKNATSAFVYLKCLSCSNELPKVDMTDRSQSSRYIILPFSLTDTEMKDLKLMDASGQIKGSSDFQECLESEFIQFLASCKEHYIKRCPTGSNIDAHEALDELMAIKMDETMLMEDFIESFFEITEDTQDRLTQKDFRLQCLEGIEYADENTGIKPYQDIKPSDIRNYLERKYEFKWKVGKIKGYKESKNIVASNMRGIKIRDTRAMVKNNVTDDEVCFSFAD